MIILRSAYSRLKWRQHLFDRRCFDVIGSTLISYSPTTTMRLLKLTRKLPQKPRVICCVRRVQTPMSVSFRGSCNISAVLLPTAPPTTNTRSLPNRRMPGQHGLFSCIGDSCCHLHALPPLLWFPLVWCGRFVRSSASLPLPPRPPTTRTAASSSLPEVLINNADCEEFALDISGRTVHLKQ